MTITLLKTLSRTVCRSRLFDLPPGVTWPGVHFAVRTTAASLIALYVAFLMDLGDPKWAAMTVWIVAQSSRGMSLSKSQYRIVGTLVGAVVGVSLIALFAQTAELCLPVLAVWLGVCTAAATALRNFRAYGAVLAGYTAAIISMDAVAAPERVFDIAVARVVYILLGIIAEATLTAVFAPGEPLNDVRKRLAAYLRQTAEVCARVLRREPTDAAVHRLFGGAFDLETAAEYAAAESGKVRRRLGHVRAAAAACLAQLAFAQTLREHLSQCDEITNVLIDETAALLDATNAEPAGRLSSTATLRNRVEAAFWTEADVMQGPPSSRLVLLDRLGALLASFHDALERQTLLEQPDPPQSRLRFAFHLDPVAALHNGIRAFVAIMVASTFWIATAWPSGAGFVIIVCVVCSLFATRANSVAGGLSFLKGAACASVAAAIYNFALLPAVSDFMIFAGIVGPIMIGTGLAMRHPRTAAPAAGFAIFFWDLIAPENSVRVDATSFFNAALTLILGIALGTLAFTLLFPANARTATTRLHRAVRADLARIGQAPTRWTREAWLSRTADRLGRLLGAKSATPEATNRDDLRSLLAAWTIGDAALALHHLASLHPAAHRPVTAVLKRIGTADPDRLARTAHRASARLAGQALRITSGERRQWLRAATMMQEIADSVTVHADFLRGSQNDQVENEKPGLDPA